MANEDTTPVLLQSWHFMRRVVRGNHSHVTEAEATKIVHGYILAVLNEEAELTLESFDDYLTSSPLLREPLENRWTPHGVGKGDVG